MFARLKCKGKEKTENYSKIPDICIWEVTHLAFYPLYTRYTLFRFATFSSTTEDAFYAMAIEKLNEIGEIVMRCKNVSNCQRRKLYLIINV